MNEFKMEARKQAESNKTLLLWLHVVEVVEIEECKLLGSILHSLTM